MKPRIFGVLLASTIALNAIAYTEQTHALITREAYSRSQLVNAPIPIFITLGIFGKAGETAQQYWDMQAPATEKMRFVDEANASKDAEYWEKRILEIHGLVATPDTNIQLRPVGWLMRGSIREDDVGKIVSETITRAFVENPFDDPYYPGLVRSFHHFFDPAKNNPYDVTFPGLSLIEP